jgi:hypothetical protein
MEVKRTEHGYDVKIVADITTWKYKRVGMYLNKTNNPTIKIYAPRGKVTFN